MGGRFGKRLVKRCRRWRDRGDIPSAPLRKKRQPCGSWLHGLGKPKYVRTPWRHRIVVFCLLVGRRPLRTRGHLCHVKDHVSPFWYIRGVTPHSLIRRCDPTERHAFTSAFRLRHGRRCSAPRLDRCYVRSASPDSGDDIRVNPNLDKTAGRISPMALGPDPRLVWRRAISSANDSASSRWSEGGS